MLVAVVGGAITMGAGVWLASPEKSADSHSLHIDQVMGFHGTRLQIPRQLGVPADLKKTDGNAFTTDDMKGHWSMLFFGYTSCPDICPTTLTTVVAARKKAGNTFPQVYFISVDPERDSLNKLSKYVKYFDKDIVGVTGSLKMLKAFALQANAFFSKVPSKSGSADDYLISHSSALMLVNPDAQLVAFINPPLTPDSILKAIDVVTNKK
jgi:protein SCO1/2